MIRDTLRFLGVQGEADPKLLRLVLDCMEYIRRVSTPKSICKRFSPDDFSKYIIGKDIKKHVEDAVFIDVMAVTLGHSVDFEIKKAQASNLTKAAILDACASAYVENFFDKNMPYNLPPFKRFSPGYGDYPLSLQPTLIHAIGAEKIGIYALDSFMLLPTKSVTAVIPIKDEDRKEELE